MDNTQTVKKYNSRPWKKKNVLVATRIGEGRILWQERTSTPSLFLLLQKRSKEIFKFYLKNKMFVCS